jgi:hypothetical protein
MVNSYSSFWQTNSGAHTQATAQSARRQCRCARQCMCPPGLPCRCSSGCVCRPASMVPSISLGDIWTEAGENEFRGRSPYRPYGNPSTLSSRQIWLRNRAVGLLGRRRFLQRQWSRRQRLNRYFAGRFGWGRHMPQLAAMIGCPTCAPGSQRFMFALSRWQRRSGLRPTGVLTPSLWWRLRQSFTSPSTMPYGMGSVQPNTLAGGPGPEPHAAGPVPMEPPATPDDAAMPLPSDEPPPPDQGPAADGELGIGFRGRRFREGLPGYERSRQPMSPTWPFA